MPYRLGLDVGTASCGLVAWTLDEKGQPTRLTFDSLDIWSEPLQPAKSGGVGEPKKAARRAARQLRRGFYRRARRLRKIAHLAALLGIDSSKVSPDAGQKIHELRALAADKRIELEELLRVLLHLAKHRGPSGDWVYMSPEDSQKAKIIGKKKNKAKTEVNNETESDDADKWASVEKKGIISGVRKLENLMEEAAKEFGVNELTLGQFLVYRRTRRESVILGRSEIGLYPSRRMVEHEFNRIWDKQAQFHKSLRSEDIRKKFFDAIFYQRPLKSPAPMVGRCSLEPTLPRAPSAQMAAQVFRIEKQIADLRWGIGRRSEPLGSQQRDVLRKLLNDTDHLTQRGELSFNKILQAFEEYGCPGPFGRGLNMERSSRESLKGNTTLATFCKLGLKTQWNTLDERTQIQVINFLADLGSPDALENDDWHIKFETSQRDPKTGHKRRREFQPALVEFINLLRKHPKFARLSTMGFDGGRMGYSIKALKMLSALMQQGIDESAAIERAYPDRIRRKEIGHNLRLPEKTGNTVVDVALRQVYRAVRRAMDTLGAPPTQVIVELSRDMALGVKKRGEIETRININNKVRRDAAKVIEEHGEKVTDKNIDRYLLWEQQMHYCPYCDQRIELGEALGSATEREHILPRTLTRVGGKRSQLVLAHKTCNNEKGNRTPYQAFGHDVKRWRIIEERAAQLAKNRQWGKERLLLLKDWEDEVLDDEAIKGFTDRQFHESSWIAKLTAHWLRSVCRDVYITRGELTAHLRRIWKLDTVIPQVRYESGLAVLDRDGTQISKEEFELYKSWWEGHNERAGGVPTDRKPDKRIDHRHHLIDALVISLTDRKLFRKMADNYKREREKERKGERAKLTLYEEPPVLDLRNQAVDIIRDAVIRHKPDRYPDGPIFNQMAYGVSRKAGDDGKRKLALSKPLIKIAEENKWNAEKIRKKLVEGIESDLTRDTVLRDFDKRIAGGADIKHIFDQPIIHPEYGTPIRRVRLLGNSEDTAAIIEHYDRNGKRLEKRYPYARNAYLEIRIENERLVDKPRLVNSQVAMNEKRLKPPRGVLRFWKGDTVQLKDGNKYIIGQIDSDSGGRLCLVPITETCVFDDLKKRGLKKKTVKGKSLTQVELLNV